MFSRVYHPRRPSQFHRSKGDIFIQPTLYGHRAHAFGDTPQGLMKRLVRGTMDMALSWNNQDPDHIQELFSSVR